jgi:hypothetical protein
MTLHIFNPEHDIALASGLENFTAPHAGRQLRHDLGWLPAIWAGKGDMVLVDNTEQAAKGLQRLSRALATSLRRSGNLVSREQVSFVTHVNGRTDISAVDPWGWDAALSSRLRRSGIDGILLPTDTQLNDIKALSHRRMSAHLLTLIQQAVNDASLIGKAHECLTVTDVARRLAEWGKIVVKAPWSSSGRGIRFIEGTLAGSVEGWLRNILQRQGSVMAEPYFNNKVRDFAMEFMSDGKGRVSYEGLSLFHTRNGAYTGNLLATEQQKEEIINRYVPVPLLERVQETICELSAPILADKYKGPFGIDMMACANQALHPCVEINLRRTMGHAALSLTRLINPNEDNEVVRVMRIVYEGNHYKLKIQRL